MHGYAGSLYFAGLLQSPIPLPSTSGTELIPPSSLSRVGGSPDCHLPLLSLALPLSPWNFYESVLSLYMEKRVSRRRVVIFTGALFSGNRELPTGRRGRGGGWF